MSRGSSIWILPPKSRKLLATLQVGHQLHRGLILSFPSLGRACLTGANMMARGPAFGRVVHGNFTIVLPDNRLKGSLS